MNDYDDLDDLERELGPSLRVALHRDAARLTGEPGLETRGLGRNTSAEVTVVDIQRTRHDGAVRRPWLVAAAAVVAAVVLIAGIVVLQGTGDDHVRTKPANPTPTTTPLPPQLFVPSSDTVFPLEGATPSTPETGELVAAVAFTRFGNFPTDVLWHDTSLELYADGRLLWFPTSDVHGGIAERRLTPEGVELVRSALAPTALPDPAETPTDTCVCIITVRDDTGSLIENTTPAPPQLVEFITHLETSLPASAWADREFRAYVPSRYGVTVWISGAHDQAVPDLSNVLAQVLPRAVVQHLDDEGWHHHPWGDFVELTTADARALAQAFTDAGQRPVSPGFNTRGMGLTYGLSVRAPDPTVILIRVEALLPDGPPLWAPG